MKQFTSFFFLLSVSFLLVCCYESKPAPKYPIDNTANSSQAQPTAPSINSAVSHYICSNNCENSGGDAAGNCPVCGNAYVHNSAYHNNAATPATPPATTETSSTNATFSDPNSTEPAQNASGVWHYTCSAGCEGGGGTAGNCSKCGGALAHNSGYHN